MDTRQTDLTATSLEVATVPDVPRAAHPPREATAPVRRRAWTEPRVRSWLVLAGVLGAAALALFLNQYLSLRKDAWLLKNGRPIDARVAAVGHDDIPGHGVAAELQSDVRLTYDVDGAGYQWFARLPGFDDGWIEVGKTIRIHVDPADPKTFTARQGRVPLLERSAIGFAILPLAAGALAVAALKRRRLLSVWNDGELIAAYVLDARNAVVAPTAWTVTCSPSDDGDNRVFHLSLPRSGARAPAKGDAVWLIVPSNGRGPAVAAAWFDRGE